MNYREVCCVALAWHVCSAQLLRPCSWMNHLELLTLNYAWNYKANCSVSGQEVARAFSSLHMISRRLLSWVIVLWSLAHVVALSMMNSYFFRDHVMLPEYASNQSSPRFINAYGMP